MFGRKEKIEKIVELYKEVERLQDNYDRIELMIEDLSLQDNNQERNQKRLLPRLNITNDEWLKIAQIFREKRKEVEQQLERLI